MAPKSSTPHTAEDRPPSSPIYEDAALFKAEPSYRGSEPEPEYSIEAAGIPEAGSQQGPGPVSSQGNRESSQSRVRARVSLCSRPTIENASLGSNGAEPAMGPIQVC